MDYSQRVQAMAEYVRRVLSEMRKIGELTQMNLHTVSMRFLLGATEGCVTASESHLFIGGGWWASVPAGPTLISFDQFHTGFVLTMFVFGSTLYPLGVMLVCSMFYTRTEIGERIGWSVVL